MKPAPDNHVQSQYAAVRVTRAAAADTVEKN